MWMDGMISDCPLAVGDVPHRLPLASKIRTWTFVADFSPICSFTHAFIHSLTYLEPSMCYCAPYLCPKLALTDHLRNARHCSWWYTRLVNSDLHKSIECRGLSPAGTRGGPQGNSKHKMDLTWSCWLKDTGGMWQECRCSSGTESGPHLTASKELGTSIPGLQRND